MKNSVLQKKKSVFFIRDTFLMASSVPKKKQVSTLERYYPSLEEIKQTYPDNLNELFEKHGDELIFQDDPNGKTMHIFFLYKKLYKCIRKGCKSTLVVEEEKIPETNPPLLQLQLQDQEQLEKLQRNRKEEPRKEKRRKRKQRKILRKGVLRKTIRKRKM